MLAGSSLSNVKICCTFLFYISISCISFSFELLVLTMLPGALTAMAVFTIFYFCF